MSGLQDTFEGQVNFIRLDWDDSSLDGTRRELGITDRTHYVLVNPDGEIVKRWFGILDEGQVESEIESFLMSDS